MHKENKLNVNEENHLPDVNLQFLPTANLPTETKLSLTLLIVRVAI